MITSATLLALATELEKHLTTGSYDKRLRCAVAIRNLHIHANLTPIDSVATAAATQARLLLATYPPTRHHLTPRKNLAAQLRTLATKLRAEHANNTHTPRHRNLYLHAARLLYTHATTLDNGAPLTHATAMLHAARLTLRNARTTYATAA